MGTAKGVRETKTRALKKGRKKHAKPKKGSPEAMFKAIDELNRTGFTLVDLQQ